MFCRFCGNEIPDGSIFCQKCGNRLKDAVAAPAEEAVKAAAAETAEVVAAADVPVNVDNVDNADNAVAKKGKLSKKTLLAIIIGSAAILLAVIAAVVIFSRGGSNKGNYILFSGETTIIEVEDSLVIVNAKGEVAQIDFQAEELSNYFTYGDINHSKTAIITRRNTDGEYSYAYDIYYYDGKNVKKIEQDLEDHPYVIISADGSTVAYSTDDAAFIYTNGKTTKIADDSYITAVSPNGKTVGYIDEENKAYYYNGKRSFVEDNADIVAIADDAKYVYLLRADSDMVFQGLYVQKKNKEESRIKLASYDDLEGVIFNSDLSQAFFGADSKTFLAKSGNEPVEVNDTAFGLILPEQISYTQSNEIAGVYLTIAGIRDFEKALYMGISDETISIFRISGGKKKTILSEFESSIGSLRLCSDGKGFLFEDEDYEKLYYYNTGSAGSSPKLLLDRDDSEETVITQDGKTVFYRNAHNEIYVLKIGGKPVKIFDGSDGLILGMTQCSNKLYFLYDGALYCSDGGKPKVVKVCNDRIDRFVGGYRVLMAVDEYGCTYISADGKSFKKVSDKNWLDSYYYDWLLG